MEGLLLIHCSLLKIERRFLVPRNDNPPWFVMPRNEASLLNTQNTINLNFKKKKRMNRIIRFKYIKMKKLSYNLLL
jgi:hypothetical protein